MRRWRLVALPIMSALYWGSCIHPDSPRLKSMPGWELDVRMALCGMCVTISMVLLTSIGRDFFKAQEDK